MPEASFVFLGPRQLGSGAMDDLPNVHFLPPVPYEDVPAVLAALDVAFLPYMENALTSRMNPLKLRELLAAGLPVVATPLPEVRRYAEWVQFARDDDDWRTELRRAVEEGRSRAGGRSASVRGEGWDVRAAEFSRLLHEAESARKAER
jgi:glycosyltransferase involved in cell wall biosynthesis